MIHGNWLIYHNCGFDMLDAEPIDNKQRSNQGFMSNINTTCSSLWLSMETRRMSLQTDASLPLCVLTICSVDLCVLRAVSHISVEQCRFVCIEICKSHQC